MSNPSGETGALRPRTPGIVYSVLAAIMALVISIVALTTVQPPPPTIAEFAPQAVEQIEDAPVEQTSDFGSGEGGAGDGALPTPPPQQGGSEEQFIDVPRVRRCIGDPPRQIEDPQSPPCVPYWEGDNGGSTWKGVTRDEITVAVPRSEPMPEGLAEAMAAFFNRRFEFYGRRIVPHLFDIADEGDNAQQQADAVTVDEEIGAFASAEYGIDIARGGQTTFYDALAARGILSAWYTTNYTPDGQTRARAPYQWHHFPDFATTQRHAAAFICRGLKDRPADHAGPGMEGQPRVFGVLGEEASGGTTYPDISVIKSELQACGAEVGPTPAVTGFDVGESRNALLQMQSAGVTTVICFCNPGSVGNVHMTNASSQGYFPEWLLADYMNTHSDWFAQSTWPQEQAGQAFGITFTNKYLDASDMPWHWAVREAAPSYDGPYDWTHYYYEVFLQLASGIQLAGPELTPDSFRSGLMRAAFPNPRAGELPYYQARVDYSGGNPWQQTDGTIIWWNRSETSPVTGFGGRFCYANQGRRYTLSTWPTDDLGLFTQPCA